MIADCKAVHLHLHLIQCLTQMTSSLVFIDGGLELVSRKVWSPLWDRNRDPSRADQCLNHYTTQLPHMSKSNCENIDMELCSIASNMDV